MDPEDEQSFREALKRGDVDTAMEILERLPKEQTEDFVKMGPTLDNQIERWGIKIQLRSGTWMTIFPAKHGRGFEFNFVHDFTIPFEIKDKLLKEVINGLDYEMRMFYYERDKKAKVRCEPTTRRGFRCRVSIEVEKFDDGLQEKEILDRILLPIREDLKATERKQHPKNRGK